MYTKKIFRPKDMYQWTKKEIGLFLLIILVEVCIFYFSDTIISIPFTPVALLGTAVAFVIGFQTSSTYNRVWEARKIWGGIVNHSRTLGSQIMIFIEPDAHRQNVSEQEIYEHKKRLIHRHIAWITALRYAMREPRPWEYVSQEQDNKQFIDQLYIPEYVTQLEDALSIYLSPEDLEYTLSKSNKQTALMYLQTQDFNSLKNDGLLWNFSFLELQNVIEELYIHQGKSERIKNFPYPRQFASMLYYSTWLFLFSLPLGMAGQFFLAGEKLASRFPGIEEWFCWVSIPFCLVVMWLFYIMNKVGRVGENPFEGTPNDVPISTISRGIEIDLRQNLGEAAEVIPAQFPVRLDTQM